MKDMPPHYMYVNLKAKVVISVTLHSYDIKKKLVRTAESNINEPDLQYTHQTYHS